MKYVAHIEEAAADKFVATCPEVGVMAKGTNAPSALEALRQEIRYRIELCPCSSVDKDWIELDLSG